jgi:L-seryl-tRNA(Ser) seleniumtransferase
VSDAANALRELPSVDRLLSSAALEQLAESYGRALIVDAARSALQQARSEIQAGGEAPNLETLAREYVERLLEPRLRRVINATGVVVHTNLGRAPLPAAAVERLNAIAGSYSNLEFDLEDGVRGSRQDHVSSHLRDLAGAEASLVVNNNAAALFLTLAALAEDREVIVSRGELVEIGDGFRIPDVLIRSGARLVEIGATNRTRAGDYEDAIGDATAMLLRVHPSNFRILGFTERPTLSELREVAKKHSVPLVDDLGSGSFVSLPEEPTVRESLDAGADLVTFSGDKLLGGPQAGIVCGRADLVERLRRHPLHRALRADKLTIAALEGTLSLYRMPERALSEVPIVRMLLEPVEAVRQRAENLARDVQGTVEQTTARAGGGALPLAELESFACSLDAPLAKPLRIGDPPVVGIVREEQLLLDCRTLSDAELPEVVKAVQAARELLQ